MRSNRSALIAIALVSLAGVARAQVTSTYDIPRLDGIVIDGRGDDWGDRGFVVHPLCQMDDPIPEGSKFSAALRIGWDSRGLLLLASVVDPDADEAESIDALFAKDSLEFFVAPSQNSWDIAQFVVTPGTDLKSPVIRFRAFDYRLTPSLLKTPLRLVAKSSRSSTGYTVEALVPWSEFGILPKVGAELAFQFNVNDTSGQIHTQLIWFPQDGAYNDAHRTNVLRLALKPTPSPTSVVFGDYVAGKAVLKIAALDGFTGKTVEAIEGERKLGSATLSRQGARAVATLSLDGDSPDRSYGPISVVSNGRKLGTVVLSDRLVGRIRGLGETPMTTSEPVFSGTSFPVIDFQNPAKAKANFGHYFIKTTYYDASGNRVETASLPGKYGAVAEVSIDSKHRFVRAFELFKAPKPLDWQHFQAISKRDFFTEMGVNPAVLAINGIGDEPFTGTNTLGLASQTAELANAKPSSGTIDARWLSYLYRYELRRQHGAQTIYNTIVSLPEGYARSAKPAPLLLFLHGVGERGDDLALISHEGPVTAREQGMKLPFIIVSAQCPYGERWNPQVLNYLLDEIEQRYRIDKTREYVTGLSMGGTGTWDLAMAYPDRFAAVVPIAEGGDARLAARMKHLPTWAFHGALDDRVPLRVMQSTVDALKAAGGDVKLTIFPDRHHDSWLPAYADPRLYEWILSHSLPRPGPRNER